MANDVISRGTVEIDFQMLKMDAEDSLQLELAPGS
jgi:hypothetical protein